MRPCRAPALTTLCLALLIWAFGSCVSQAPQVESAAAAADDSGTKRESAVAAEKETGPIAAEPARGMEPSPAPDASAQRSLIRRAVGVLTEGAAVRIDADNHLGAVFDLDGNGSLDIGVLALGAEFADLAHFGVLSDTTRLYRPDARTPEIFLVVFGVEAGIMVERHRFALGRRRVVTGLAIEPLRPAQRFPAAFVTNVTTRDGSEQYWTTFTGDGIPAMLLVDNTGSTRTVVTDIEGNGYVDFVRYQPVFEQGRGYDTLITWTRWTGTGFEVTETTNIVRNLTRFLDAASRLLVRGAWEEYLAIALLPGQKGEIARQAWTVEQAIDSLFLSEDDGSFSTIAREQRIEEIVLPEIARNPFPAIGSETSFRTSLRLITPAGQSHFFQAEIGMQQNPFQSQQFFFRQPLIQGE